MKRRLTCLALVVLLLTGMALPVQAASEKALHSADYLNSLGLFNGVGTGADGKPNYDLDRAPTRQEAVTMLVRLLGKEDEAVNGTWDMPFTDVDDWAAPYVGYAYAEGLTKGMSETAFGGSLTVSAAQYITFILRALGYSSETDFAWDAAWEKSDALGITDGSYTAQNNGAFLRGDVAVVSANALGANMKNGSSALLEVLKKQGAVAKTAEPMPVDMEDQYLAFAKQMLAAEGKEYVIPVSSENKITADELGKVFGQYDIYSYVGGDISADDSLVKEKILIGCLKSYTNACVDGDYSRNINVNATVGASKSGPGGVLLTDRRGTVVGYGIYLQGYPKQIEMVQCSLDSRDLVKNAVAAFEEMFDALPKVACEAGKENGQYVYRFSGIPETAVWMDCVGSGASMGKMQVDVKAYINDYQNMLQGGRFDGIAVANPYVTSKLDTFEGATFHYTVFVFLDAQKNIVGYALGTLG